MKYLLLLLTTVIAVNSTFSQEKKTLAERLGYAKGAKLLIVHADDLGVSHSENQATIDGFTGGMVNSGSIMMPCPWVPEIADYAIKNPEADLGLHLTLTAEWKLFKWDPVLPVADVPGLVNDKGFMYDNCNDVTLNASVEEVEKEAMKTMEKAETMEKAAEKEMMEEKEKVKAKDMEAKEMVKEEMKAAKKKAKKEKKKKKKKAEG